MPTATIDHIHLDDEESLDSYFDTCGLSALPHSTEGEVSWRRATCTMGNVMLGLTSSASAWGFEPRQSADVYLVSYTHEGESLWEMTKYGSIHSSRQLCIIDGTRLVQARFAAGTETESIVVDAATLHSELAAAQGFPCTQRIEFQPLLTEGYRAWPMLSSIMQSLRSGVSLQPDMKSPLALTYLRQALIGTIIEALPHNYESRTVRAQERVTPKHIGRAIDYMHAHIREDISLSELASYACTSARNLQLGFKIYKGTTPLRYLRSIRLAAARADILNPDLQLSWRHIAGAWGFVDLGLFSKYYKRAFGETPYQSKYPAIGATQRVSPGNGRKDR